MDATTMRFGAFGLILLLMAVAEAIAPRRALRFGRKRWPSNLGIVVIDSIIVRLLIPGGAVTAALWAAAHDFGLFNQLDWTENIEIVIAIILLDLFIYGQHVLFHAVPALWRLHMVHHADRDIDVTTGLRFHPLEIILSMLIKMAIVILFGMPVMAVILFEIVLNGMAMFNHANVRLAKKMDGLLRLLVITPDVHRVHHSIIRSETNSNYGFNLSLWDRLFGTFREQPEHGHDGMTIGLEHLQTAPTHQLGFMLRLPFGGDIGQYPILKSKGDRHE
ncbi:MAG: sterol desaturase family protein [Mariprofundus sp.]|nr:sterol desaturase family protein [Mariprofundus sp.]